MSLHQLYVALFVGGLVLLASIAATRLATGAGLPSLLLFLGVGVLVGEDGLGLHFDNAQLAQDLGTAALGIILVEGGLTTRFSDIRKVLAPAGVLATVGVGVSTLVTAAAVHWLLGMRLAAGPVARGHRVEYRCGGGVLGASGGAAAQATGRPAGGGVGLQRRPGRHPRAAVQRHAV